MQPITPSSQSQHQVAACDVDKSEDNQSPSTAFARTITAAHGHDSASTATGEQPTDQVDTSQTGLLARTIKETQALSIRSESLPGASHLPEGQLPAGHTYRPYFWLSRLAHRLMAQDTNKWQECSLRS